MDNNTDIPDASHELDVTNLTRCELGHGKVVSYEPGPAFAAIGNATTTCAVQPGE